MSDRDASLEWLDGLRGYYDNNDTSERMADAVLVRDEPEVTHAPKTGQCAVCGGGIWLQDCPTGSWWVHNQHPADNHDAEGNVSSKQPGCTCWSTNDKHALSCRLSRGVELPDVVTERLGAPDAG